MASEELLSPADDVPDDDCRTQRKDQVLIVWVQNQSLFDVTCTNKELIKTQIRLRSKNGGGEGAVEVLRPGSLAASVSNLPLNPITAARSRSFETIVLFVLGLIFKFEF